MPRAQKLRQRACKMEVLVDVSPGTIHVELRCDGEKAGELNAYDVEPVTLRPECLAALGRLSTMVGSSLTPYLVFRSWLPEEMRGSGLGTALYLAATEAAAKLGGALLQHSCFYDAGDPSEAGVLGSTSDIARLVWEGSRFRATSKIQGGSVAYLPEEHWGKSVAMVRFGQIEFGANGATPQKNTPFAKLAE